MAENTKKKPTPQIPPHYVFISDPWFVTTMSNVKYFGFHSEIIRFLELIMTQKSNRKERKVRKGIH